MEKSPKSVKKKKLKEEKQAEELLRPVQETTEIPEKQQKTETAPVGQGKKTGQLAAQPKKTLILGVPNYLLALAVLLAIVGGMALGIYLKPKALIIDPIGGNSDENKAMEIELIYSNDCSFCAKHNTILDSFLEKNIPFTVKETEATTNEGIQKIAAFQLNILPAAIVPASGLKNFPEILAAMGQSFKKTANYFVVPESNLDSSKIYPRMYLNPVDPADCNASDAKSSIILFDDPYNELMIKMQPTIDAVLSKFKDSTKVEFAYIQANSSTLKLGFDQNLKTLAAKYIVCTGNQQLFGKEFNKFVSVYCGTENSKLSPASIAACPINPHFGTPLSLEELKKTLDDQNGLKETAFDQCLGVTDFINKSAVARAKNYGITRTGTAIVDCKYNAPYTAIGLAICASKPWIEACKTNDQNSSS